ncbi:hypothetical protein RAS12_12055 [Achromobacter seleniivolatilans]|uniref:Uncharacterized protein n=1 Tax=Achromobacter seleniivolatilans TaxID=3047478 RepID=A0ABY9M7V0_9BURK|nr:hypothetical protein [Achromobacter sp. R39]WMD23071.1 hypothetical protein RAS12_12055 [Achromobacter sp. R39]
MKSLCEGNGRNQLSSGLVKFIINFQGLRGMSLTSRKFTGTQPVLSFLVASSLTFGAFFSATVLAGAQGPADAAAVRFIHADASQTGPALKAWTREQTREAAAEAEAVIRRAAFRVRAALNGNDAAFFMGAGDQYVQQEWPLFTAQEVPYVFGVQAYDLKNSWVPSYSTCEGAGKALGDWYHFFRTGLHNGYALADLKATGAAEEVERELWTNLAACQQAL